jgi:hypothetical protein
MVGVNEFVSTLSVGDLGVDQEMRTYLMGPSQSLGKSDAETSRYALPGGWTHMQVAMQTPAAFPIGLHDDADVRLFRLSHLSSFAGAYFVENNSKAQPEARC